MRVTNSGKEAAAGKESENGDREARSYTPTVLRSAKGWTESGQTGLSNAISRARAGIHTYAANHWARLSSAHIPDRRNGSRDNQGTVSPQGPQARPTPEGTPTPGLRPLAHITPNDNPQDEEEPTRQGREGITHHRLTRPTGISTIRGAASAWSSFLDACRH